MKLSIDTNSPKAIYHQIFDHYKKLIVSHRLLPGESLPNMYSLAVELGTSPIVVRKAYFSLAEEGLVNISLNNVYVKDNNDLIKISYQRQALIDDINNEISSLREKIENLLSTF